MSSGILRYYLYLESDTDKITELIRELQSHEVVYDSVCHDMEQPKRCYELSLENIKVLVVRLKGAEITWAEYLNDLNLWEEAAGIFSELLLGQITVFTLDESNFDGAVAALETEMKLHRVLELNLDQGTLVRLNWFWIDGQAFYACHLQEETQPNQDFLERGLPLLEARLIKLQTISKMYQDTAYTVSNEKEELDRKLSDLLHSDLVTEQARHITAEELEEQVNIISASYGILAGHYRVIRQGYQRQSAILNAYRQQIRTQPGLQYDAYLVNRFLSPYDANLNELKNMEQDIEVSRENHSAAIDVVRSRIEILISRENIKLQNDIRNMMEVNNSIQKQGITFQVAASLVEFIVLAYYTLSIWKYLAPGAYTQLPGWVLLITITLFSGNAVYCTHLIAERMQGDKHVIRKLIYALIPLIILFLFMIVAGAAFSGSGGGAGIH